MSDWWNSIGSDWNAPFRGSSTGGVGYQQSGLLPRTAPGTPQGVGPAGFSGVPASPMPPGQGAPSMGYPAATAPGATLNTTGPDIYPPNSRPINPTRQVGSFTGGTSTEANWFDPRTWFKADPNATFAPGEPMTRPGGPAASGPPGLPKGLGGGFWPTLIYSSLYSPPAETGELPRQTLGRSPSGPNDMFQSRGPGGIGSDARYPVGPPITPSKTPASASRPRSGDGGRARAPIPPQDVNLGHYIPTTGVGRGAGSYVTPGGQVIAPGPLSMFQR